jgi:hypothetical protein
VISGLQPACDGSAVQMTGSIVKFTATFLERFDQDRAHMDYFRESLRWLLSPRR